MKRNQHNGIPADLRQADELIERYGRWAQDRFKKQRCASAEGKYVPPPPKVRDKDDKPMEPLMPEWSAMNVQRALQVVPKQFRMVLFAIYVPQKEHPMAARRRMRITAEQWERSWIEGLRKFWAIYYSRHLRPLTKGAITAPILRDTKSCAPVA